MGAAEVQNKGRFSSQGRASLTEAPQALSKQEAAEVVQKRLHSEEMAQKSRALTPSFGPTQ